MSKEYPTQASLEEISQLARRNTLETGGHVPIIIAEGEQQTVITVIEQLQNNFAARAEQMFLLGLFIARTGEIGVLQQFFYFRRMVKPRRARSTALSTAFKRSTV